MSERGSGSIRRGVKRAGPPIEVQFPVTPLLDMAFQLLAFFVLTFQAPTAETRLDLYLPATPAALPGAFEGQARTTAPLKIDVDIDNDLWIRAEADDLGDLKSLTLGEAPVKDLGVLADRLRRYSALLDNKPLRVRIMADDSLRYEDAARIIGVCSSSGVASVRLADRGGGPSSTSPKLDP